MSVSCRIFLASQVFFTLLICGCSSGIGVRRADGPNLLAAWKASMTPDDGLSPRTMQTVRQLDLAPMLRRNPPKAFARLHKLATKYHNPDLLFALAEITYRIGRDLEDDGDSEAIAYYYLCAGYSYHFLFSNDQGVVFADSKLPQSTHLLDKAFDPRFRLACDLYNNGLSKCILAAQKVGRLDPCQELILPTANGGKFRLSVTHHGFPWRPEEFGELKLSSDYQVVGLPSHFRGYGLGVPLIGVRNPSADTRPCSAFYPKEVSYPVTAFFRFEGSLADLGARRAGRLELYNPLTIKKIPVRGRPIPLETDLTTPLAYFLSRTDWEDLELTGFLRGEQVRDKTGIYMFEPYQPGKIPVLMVHGLLSSPLTWAPVFNELRADARLNEKYQFWFYMYPTGNPYFSTAADLRGRLRQLRQELDPYFRDPNLDQMVVVGHSMGGLVSKLLTQDSRQDFWHLVSKEPFGALKASPEVRQQLQGVFFFDHDPGIKRVVFLGTPHRGSKLSPSIAGRIAANLVQTPKGLMQAAKDLIKKNPGLKIPGAGNRIPTSIDMLSPESPALEILANRPPPQGVKYHSVIGVYRGSGPSSHDGVVRYSSAHVRGVESEILVPSHHVTLHHHPRAILEVRRILHHHFREVEKNTPILPTRNTGKKRSFAKVHSHSGISH